MGFDELMKCLSCKHEDLSLISQNPYEKSWVYLQCQCWRDGERRVPGAHRLANLVYL